MYEERGGVEELAGWSIQREVPLSIIDGIVIYSGELGAKFKVNEAATSNHGSGAFD